MINTETNIKHFHFHSLRNVIAPFIHVSMLQSNGMVDPGMNSTEIGTQNQCSQCKFSSTTMTNLRRHEMSHNRETKLKYCFNCDYSFIKASHLKRHEMTHIGEMPFKCDMCDYASTQKTNLKRHIYDMHTENKPMKPKREYKKEFKCLKCDYEATSVSKLRRHDNVHTSEMQKVEKGSTNLKHCDYCDYINVSGSKLKMHEMTHTGELPHMCNMCDYASTQSTNLKRHIADMHTENKPKKPKRVNKKQIQCPECDYADISGSHLKRHMVTHTGERAHKCNMCDYASTQAASVKRHIDSIHSENKPKRENKRIQCMKCDYGATSLSKLKEHDMIHTGEMPHKCNQCSFASSRERNLRKHMETHHENREKVAEDNLVNCLKCKYSTPSLSELVKHLMTHPEVKDKVKLEESVEEENKQEEEGLGEMINY